MTKEICTTCLENKEKDGLECTAVEYYFRIDLTYTQEVRNV